MGTHAENQFFIGWSQKDHPDRIADDLIECPHGPLVLSPVVAARYPAEGRLVVRWINRHIQIPTSVVLVLLRPHEPIPDLSLTEEMIERHLRLAQGLLKREFPHAEVIVKSPDHKVKSPISPSAHS